MVRLKCGGLVMLAVSVTAAGCGQDSVTTPINPTPIVIVETFAGTLTIGGGVTQPFLATGSGAVSVAITSLADSNGPAASGPDGTIRVGLQLGTWNGTACYVPTAYSDNAYVSTALNLLVTSAGALCARVYDSRGLTEPVDFEISISHP